MQIQANPIAPGPMCSHQPRNFKNDAGHVNRSTVQQCLAVRVSTASSSPSRGGTACDTVLSSRADNTLAGAQRIQAGMNVFLGDLCSAALRFVRDTRQCTRPKADESITGTKTSKTIPFDGVWRLLCPSPTDVSICVQRRCLPSGGLTGPLSRFGWAD